MRKWKFINGTKSELCDDRWAQAGDGAWGLVQTPNDVA